VWVEVPDERTHAVARRFRVSRYDPQPDGSIIVTEPRAEFYFQNGQMVALDGSHGKFYFSTPPMRSSELQGPIGPPSRGDLHDVVIRVYQNNDRRRPVMTANVNNVSFDNDTFRIATERYTESDGTVVPADQVPVQLRGDMYDFDGRGLTIRWNDRDRRLETLEIAHGESLTLKSNQFLGGGGNSSSAASAAPRSAPPSTAPRGRTRTAQVAAAPETKPDESRRPIYHAMFEGPVRVTQNDAQIALAKTMFVDFKPDEQDEAETAPANALPPTTRPTTREARQAGRQRATTRPSTSEDAPAEEPIVVHWPGKLTIVPLDDAKAPKLNPGEMQVEMVSTDEAVVLNHQGREIRCGSFVYNGSDDSLTVRTSPVVPIISMKDAAGATFFTQSIVYDGASKRAVLEGESHAEIPVRDEKTNAISIMTAKWKRSCELTMAGQSRDQMTIQQAILNGEVDIQHPRLKLVSDRTQIDFAPPAHDAAGKQQDPQVREFQAFDRVKCDMTDERQQTQHITTDHLTLTMAEGAGGKLSPSVMTAEGNVHTFTDDRDLRCGGLKVEFDGPADSPHVKGIYANEDVTFSSKDATGHCGILEAHADGDDYDVSLYGSPATLTSDQSTLSGPLITIVPKQQNVKVLGAGTLHGISRRSPDDPPTPFDLKWDDWMNMMGAENHIEVKGNVAVATVMSSDGSKVDVSGDSATVELMEDPQARPATRPATTGPAGTNGFSAFDSMRGKTVRSVKIDGKAIVNSNLTDADNTPVRTMHMEAPTLKIDAQARRLLIPAAGRLLMENLSRSTTRPATTQPADFRGATAFSWEDQLSYEQDKNRADMTGKVHIVHLEPTTRPGVSRGRFDLFAPHVAADFVSDSDKTTTRPASPSSDAKLKLVTADQGVHFESAEVSLDAERITYDAGTGILAAYGTDAAPVQVFDSKGVSSGSFQEFWYNTRTRQWDHVKGLNMQYNR
jgi:hypothetical protein